MSISKKLVKVFSLFLALALLPMGACSTQETDSSSSQESSQAQSSSAEASAASEQSGSKSIEVNVAIDSSAIKGDVPSDLKEKAKESAYELPEGATAYDALVATGAKIEGDPSYVTSIDGIGEGMDGKSSGWMYEVNGEMPMDAANKCVLKGGDVVRWYYSSWE